MKSVIKLITVSLLTIMTVSCAKNREITFDKTEPLALVNGINWGVINQPYAAFRTEAGYDKPISAEARKTEIYMVTGKCTLEKTEGKKKVYTVWYKFEEGWLDESSVDIYSNRYKAETASKKMN